MKKFALGLVSLSLLLGIQTASFAEKKGNDVKPSIGQENVSASAIFNEYEPNNTIAEANPFIIGNQIHGNFLTPDSDNFAFTPTETKTYTFYFTHNSNQKYILYLRDENNTPLQSTSSDMSQNSFTYTVQAGKKYILKASYVLGSNSSSYSREYDIYTF